LGINLALTQNLEWSSTPVNAFAHLDDLAAQLVRARRRSMRTIR
jgi:hypothetical protein